MADLELFKQYLQLADLLIAQSTKEDVAETARLLALNLAHYQSKFGELPLDESLAMLHSDTPNTDQLAMLTAGMENLVGVLGMLKGGQLDDPESIH